VQAPSFFVPTVSDKQEEAYAGFANWCQRAVPDSVDRVYSITFTHDGDEWTATVGEALRGIRRRYSRKRGTRVEHVAPLSDPAVVLAIFAGYPYLVVTNHRVPVDVRSAWENPFMAGEPDSVTYFSPHAPEP